MSCAHDFYLFGKLVRLVQVSAWRLALPGFFQSEYVCIYEAARIVQTRTGLAQVSPNKDYNPVIICDQTMASVRGHCKRLHQFIPILYRNLEPS